jgi:hypothetical protein
MLAGRSRGAHLLAVVGAVLAHEERNEHADDERRDAEDRQRRLPADRRKQRPADERHEHGADVAAGDVRADREAAALGRVGIGEERVADGVLRAGTDAGDADRA